MKEIKIHIPDCDKAKDFLRFYKKDIDDITGQLGRIFNAELTGDMEMESILHMIFSIMTEDCRELK